MLQLSRITNHLPGIQPMGFNQPPYSSGEIPVCFLHFKNRSEAPQTEAPVSVASRFLAPRWRRRSDTHTHTHLHPCPRTPVLFFGPCSLAPDWLFASSKDPTITRPCRTPAPHEKQLMCSRGSIHLSGLPIRRRSAFFFFLPVTHFAIGSLSFESEITKCRTYGGKEEEMSQRSLRNP